MVYGGMLYKKLAYELRVFRNLNVSAVVAMTDKRAGVNAQNRHVLHVMV
jgi:hypothetical protein